MTSTWIVRSITLWMIILAVPLDALIAATTSATTTKNKLSYLQTVTDWLDKEQIPWRLQQDGETVLFPRKMTTQPILEVRPRNNAQLYYLHMLKSPNETSECVLPSCTRDMTNHVQFVNNMNAQRRQEEAPKINLIHLHEDVWRSKTVIVQSRLLIRLGSGIPISRVYARKTVARRIDAGTALPFLHKNHLWSATKARYYYGLFLPTKSNEEEEILVAVATFSSKRNVRRGNRETRCFELLRFCTRVDGNVVGGITKLIRASCRF